MSFQIPHLVGSVFTGGITGQLIFHCHAHIPTPTRYHSLCLHVFCWGWLWQSDCRQWIVKHNVGSSLVGSPGGQRYPLIVISCDNYPDIKIIATWGKHREQGWQLLGPLQSCHVGTIGGIFYSIILGKSSKYRKRAQLGTLS